MRTDNDLTPIEKIIFVGVLCALIVFSISIAVSGQTSVISKDTVFVELLENRADISGGYARFKFYCPLDSGCNLKDVGFSFTAAKLSGINDYSFCIEKTRDIEVPVYERQPIMLTCSHEENGTEYICPGYQTVQTGTKMIKEDYCDSTKGIIPKGTYTIKISASWSASIGQRAIDWIPSLTLDKKDYPELTSSVYVQKQEWAWWNSSFTKCRNITITNVGLTELENFPALVNLTYDSDMQADYSDIRFTDGEDCFNGGALVPFELDTATSQYALYWVNVTIPSAGAVIQVYYKNDTAVTNAEDPYNTWNSGYIFVHHMVNDGGTAIVNSKSGSYNGTMAGNPTTAAATSCKIGTCKDFDGAGDWYALADTNLAVGQGDRTVTLWYDTDSTNSKRTFGYGTFTVGNAYEVNTATTENIVTHTYNYNGNLTIYTGTWYFTGVSMHSLRLTSWLNMNLQYDGNMNGATNTKLSGSSYIAYGPGTGEFNGRIDEIRFSNVSRSQDWLNETYLLIAANGLYVTEGTETGYTVFLDSIDNPGNTTYGTSTIDLNVTTTTDALNCSYMLDSGSNTSMYNSTTTNWYAELIGLSDSLHHAEVYCTDGSNNAYDDVWFTIDTTTPGVQIFYPLNITIMNSTTTIALNVSANKTINTYWYTLNGANSTFSPNTTITPTTGANSITVWVNDSFNNIASYGPVYFTLFYYNFGPTIFNENAIEGSNQNHTINITFSDISLMISNDYVFYLYDIDGAYFYPTHGQVTGNTFELYTAYDVQNISGTQEYENVSFRWYAIFNYSGPTNESNTTTDIGQTIHQILITNCSNTTLTNTTTMHYYLMDEQDGTQITINGTFDATFLLWYGNTYHYYSFQEDNATNFRFCIYPTWADYNISGTIEYNATGYFPRTYSLPTTSISNTSQDIDLYLLSEDDASYVLVYVRDASDSGVPGVFLVLQKYDAGTGSYTNITSLETDDAGKALTIMELNTVYYRFWVLDADGNTLKITNKQVIPNTVDNPENVYIKLASSMNEWLQIAIGLTYNCTKDNIYNYTNCSIQDGSGLIGSACLAVQWLGVNGFVTICDSCNSSMPNSTLSCFFGSNANGTYRYSYYVNTAYNSYSIEIGTILIPGSLLFGDIGILATIFLIMVMSAMALWRPEVAGLFAVAALIISMMFGLIVVSIGSIIGLLFVAGIMVYTRR